MKKATALTVKVEALSSATPANPETDAARIKASFIAGDPHRAAVFERMLLEGRARIAATAYLRALGQLG